MLRHRLVSSPASAHCVQQQRRPHTATCLRNCQRCRHNLDVMHTCNNIQEFPCAALQSITQAEFWQHQQQHLADAISCTKQAQPSTIRHHSRLHAPTMYKERCNRLVCSSAAGSPSFPEDELINQQAKQQQQQQQQFPRQQPEVQQEQSSSRPPSPSAMPHLMHMQPPPQPISVPSMLAWMPPQLLLHLKSLASFLGACWALLPEFVSPSLPEALRRLVLVLGASLLLVVVVSTIDSAWLYMYLLNARRVPVAA